MTKQITSPIAHVENKMGGEDVWIVGSGPSLDDIDERKLQGKYIYALNWSYKLFLDYEKYPDAWWLYCDKRAYYQVKDYLQNNKVQVIVEKRNMEQMRSLRQFVHWVWYPRNTFSQERSIAETALQMADFCGFDRAFLVGIDGFRIKPGQPYTRKIQRNKCYFMKPEVPGSERKSSRDFVEKINSVAKRLKKLKVFICSDLYPIDESPMFKKISFEEALNASNHRRDSGLF